MHGFSRDTYYACQMHKREKPRGNNIKYAPEKCSHLLKYDSTHTNIYLRKGCLFIIFDFFFSHFLEICIIIYDRKRGNNGDVLQFIFVKWTFIWMGLHAFTYTYEKKHEFVVE